VNDSTGRLRYEIFDSHLHIIDPRYPLIPNQGYLPEAFTIEDYRTRMCDYRLVGGAVVAGSFQAYDQTWLRAALRMLGLGFVGVTQLPVTVGDDELLQLHADGVRALRFNLHRGGSESVEHLERMARRVHDLAGWHVELYVDSRELAELMNILLRLPALSIDHLGLSKAGRNDVLKLVERGARVKACGFGRIDSGIGDTLRAIHACNPAALMFGSDLPSTRAPRAYVDADALLILDTLGEQAARKVFHENAAQFYRIGSL
jgi:predicted TIM-barrel fold metal-dependent hydrolase